MRTWIYERGRWVEVSYPFLEEFDDLAQELPTPRHFEQASSMVTEEMVTDALPCGPDPEKHLAAIRQYIEAGFDEVYVQQIGPQQEGFFRFFEKELRPKL
jgi:hypothetical protein